MFYRRKILLALLEAFGGDLANTDFQKLLFLYCRRSNSTHYDFFPYKFGGFSLVSYHDKRKLIEVGILANADRFKLSTSKSYLKELKSTDRNSIRNFAAQAKNLRGKRLVRAAYKEYPEYAVRSEIASTVFTQEELQEIKKRFEPETKPTIMTIGYEGKSIDAYLNKLIRNGVIALIDVRKHPISRKYGFSKTKLSSFMENASISYYHLSGLGISSKLRKGLNGIESYRKLFEVYEKQILPENQEALEKLRDIFEKHQRIALACYEKEYIMCHRHKLAKVLQNNLNTIYPISHL
jgi:uncharacterized protein (DUF488 family)